MENSEFGRQNISDRRDTQRDIGLQYLKQINKFFDKLGIGKIATVIGRFWAMDMDNRWNRVEQSYP